MMSNEPNPERSVATEDAISIAAGNINFNSLILAVGFY